MLNFLDASASMLLRAEPQTVLSLLIAVGTVLLYRRFKDAATLLLLIGAVAHFLVFAGSAFTSHAATHAWIAPSSSFWHLLVWPHSLAVLATLCFPVGFVWHALRIARSI